MSRIRITIPTPAIFQTHIPIRISDMNYGGHVGHDTILTLLHEARAQFFRQYGYSENNVGGCGVIMGDCALIYQAEVFYGESVQVDISIGDFTRCGFAMYYAMTKVGVNLQTIPVATAKTGIVCFDYATRKVASIPEPFKALFIGSEY